MHRTMRLLQRSAGNRAVGRLVSPRRARRLLARYESPERQDIGDRYFRELEAFLRTAEGAEWVKRYGLDADVAGMSSDQFLAGAGVKVAGRTLSAGEVIALSGDFYGSPEALERADPKELAELLAAIERERRGELTGPQANATYQEITLRHRPREQSFLELAKRNEPHFTPGNRAAWRTLHEQALEMARTAKSDDAAFNLPCCSTPQAAISSPMRSPPGTSSTRASSKWRSTCTCARPALRGPRTPRCRRTTGSSRPRARWVRSS